MSLLTEMLDAETILENVNNEMEKEFQESGKNWPRDWMVKHVQDRATLLKARQILIDRCKTLSKIP